MRFAILVAIAGAVLTIVASRVGPDWLLRLGLETCGAALLVLLVLQLWINVWNGHTQADPAGRKYAGAKRGLLWLFGFAVAFFID
jgi:hypothetical protein